MEQNDRIPLSYLSQFTYCPRRAGLLLLERIWTENEYTASGRAEHERVHTARFEKRGQLVKLYEYAVFSERLQLSGKCDCIEATADGGGCALPFSTERYRLYPIEYKHGTVRRELEYEVQLCAQAMCLEEMYGCPIPEGALFYIDAHRREPVALTEVLRATVSETAKALQRMLQDQQIPAPQYSQKCRKCSLAEDCMPKMRRTAKSYCEQVRAVALDGEAE